LLAAAPAAEDLPPIDWFGPAGAGGPAGIGAPVDGTLGSIAPIDAGFWPGVGAGIVGGVIGGAVIGGGGGGGVVVAPGSPVHIASPASPVGADAGGLVTAAVPEPRTWALLLLGVTALVAEARRRAARKSKGGAPGSQVTPRAAA
jgi:hypothetical protein